MSVWSYKGFDCPDQNITQQSWQDSDASKWLKTYLTFITSSQLEQNDSFSTAQGQHPTHSHSREGRDAQPSRFSELRKLKIDLVLQEWVAVNNNEDKQICGLRRNYSGVILEPDVPSRHRKHYQFPGSVHRVRKHMLFQPRGIQPSAKTLQFLWGFLSNLLVTTRFLGTWRFSRHTPCSNTAAFTWPGSGQGATCHVSSTAQLLAPSPEKAGCNQSWLLGEMVVLTGCIQPTVTCSCILFSVT